LAAIALLISHEFTALQGRPMGVLWMELGALSWAIGTLWMRRISFTLPVQSLTVWMMLLSSPLILLVAAGTETWPTWELSPLAWGSLAYAVLINYGFAQIIWFGMARDLPPATSAMSIMAVPVVGTLSGSDGVCGLGDCRCAVAPTCGCYSQALNRLNTPCHCT
jgi:drug/metabolite transporter (DMT)-like permease